MTRVAPVEVGAGIYRSSATAAAPRPRRPRLTEGRVVFALCLLSYTAVALWFWRAAAIPVDAVSRVANAYYVVFSRDPHLAAVGFVWSPLPSLVLIPALPLKAVAPALTRDALVAVLSSAVFMAGTVAVCNDILRRFGVGRAATIGLTVALAVHPMILVYGGNGMSEGGFLFLLAVAIRAFVRWLVEGKAERLVAVGVSLSLAYATRYEAVAPAVAVPAVVAAASWCRGRGRATGRWSTACTDAVLVALPVVLSVAGWALASRVIVGQWLATFSSEYGNSAQVAAALRGIEAATGDTLPARLAYGLRQSLGLAPLAPLLLLLAAAVGIRRRDPRVLAPAAVLLPVLAFDNVALLTGTSFGWLRFQITVVPLAVLLGGAALARRAAPVPAARAAPAPGGVGDGSGPMWWLRTHRRAVATAAVIVAVALAVPIAAVTLRTPRLAREESGWPPAAGARREASLVRLNTRVAQEIDDLALPDGAVLTDSAYSFAIILASRHPRQFVITSDRDFRQTLRDPRGHQVRYLLVSAKGAADAVRGAYQYVDFFGPGLPGARVWTDELGAGWWTLVPVEGLD